MPDLALGWLIGTLGPRMQRDVKLDTACADSALVSYLSDEFLHPVVFLSNLI